MWAPSLENDHTIIADIAIFGERRIDSVIEKRIEDFLSHYKFKDSKSYSCIITSATRNCKSVKKFLYDYGFSEIGSTVGYHSNRLYYYYRPKGK